MKIGFGQHRLALTRRATKAKLRERKMLKTRARRAQGRGAQALGAWTTYNRAKTLRTSMASTDTSMKRLLVHRFQID